MKTQKKFVIAFVIIFCHSFCYSQQRHPSASRELEQHKKSINTTAYIFLGSVTQQQNYYGKNKEILTCSIISITKIFKGTPQIKLGSIKVITSQGGHIGNIYARLADDGRGITLSNGATYIIFGRQAYPYMLADTMTTTDNTLILTTMGCDNPVVFSGNNSARWGYTSYKTLDELYSFFKENGVTVQEEAQQK